jgi:hypothetical protein
VRALAVLLALAAPAGAGEVDLPGLLARLEAEAPQVVILGEVHDNPDHHAVQAAAVAAVQPAAIVLEMATMAEAAAAAGVDRADAAALAAALGWPGSGWPDFAMYHPVLVAAPGARLYGAEVPGDLARRAVTGGAAAVFGPGAADFGLDRPLPASEQAAREAEQFTAHCEAMPREMMGGMVEAQRLRDAYLAKAALQALRDTGGPVAVITGWGHARKDWGVPALLALADPGVSVLSLGQLEADPGPKAPFDLWIIADPVPRGDPCAVFRDG